MFYYNTKYHFKLKPGSPEAGCGGILLASAISAEQLERRQFTDFPHLQHRVFDPQLYLASLDPGTAETPVLKLATYPWFGLNPPPYDSGKYRSTRAYRDAHAADFLTAWPRKAPTDPAIIAEGVRAAVTFQVRLGCQAIILPSPLTDTWDGGLRCEVAWLEAGLEACRELRVSLPVYATVALKDQVLRRGDPLGDTLLETITGQIAARERLAGAYVVIETTGDDLCCCSGDTVMALLLLVDDLARGAGRQVIVNWMGAAGAMVTAAGASIWGAGYFPSWRRLRLSDLDDKEGALARPRYYSTALMGDIGLKDDLLRVQQLGLGPALFTRTRSARTLHAALERGRSPDTLPLWENKPGNHSLAMPHYYECMYELGRALHGLDRAARLDYVHEWLEQAVELADALRGAKPKLSRNTDLKHQRVWLRAYSQWREHAGV